MHVIGYITHIWRTFWCSVNSFSYALNTSVPIRERQQAVLGQGITDARKHSARAHNIIPCKHAFSFRISDHEIINERIDAQYTAAHLIQYNIYEKYATAVRSPCKVGQCCCSALFPLELGRHVSRIRACPADLRLDIYQWNIEELQIILYGWIWISNFQYSFTNPRLHAESDLNWIRVTF